jgi:hypothetical protein
MSFDEQSHLHSPDTLYNHQPEISYRITEPNTPPYEQPPYKKLSSFPKNNHHKKLSRLSLAFEKTITHDHNTSSLDDNDYQSVICLIPITINIPFGDQVRSLPMKVNKSSTIKLVIQKAIDEYNNVFSKENTKFRIKEDAELFILKPSKKNGKAKLDMPCFNEEILVSNCYTSNFSLLWKEDPEDIKQMFELNKRNKQHMCKGGCVVF